MTLKSHRAVDIGVVVRVGIGCIKADVRGQSVRARNRCTIGSNRCLGEQALDKHGHLLTGDVVIR